MATDQFANNQEGLTSPADGAEVVVPDDVSDLTNVSRALYVGGAGDIAVEMANGDTVTFVGVLAGTVLPIRINRVNSTNTTATNMIAIS